MENKGDRFLLSEVRATSSFNVLAEGLQLEKSARASYTR